MKNFAFNVTFTRPDENNEHKYKIGYNVYGQNVDTFAQAKKRLQQHFSHLTIIEVELFAITEIDY